MQVKGRVNIDHFSYELRGILDFYIVNKKMLLINFFKILTNLYKIYTIASLFIIMKLRNIHCFKKKSTLHIIKFL